MRSPVLIVGAGPTGLVLALWLAKSGISFRIIEKNSGPGQASRAMAVQARTLEFYRQLGIADEIIASGIVMNQLHLRKGSREVARLVFRGIGEGISPYPFVLSFPQDDHEKMLVKLLEETGQHVEWNTELVDFKDEGNGVRATLKKSTGDEETADFEYVVGCDGARSTVRQKLNLGFPGGTYEQMFFVADVHATGLAFNQDVNACITPQTFCLAFPVRSSKTFRLIGVIPKEIAGKPDLSIDDLRPYIKKQFDADIQDAVWFSTYHVHHRVADEFRRGRIFIAGDAGHIHSPAGGQGMNTGIGDAVNLGWKLASVLRGRSNPAILDTYNTERLEFAHWLVKTTDRLFQGVVGTGIGPMIAREVILPYVVPLLLRFRATRRAQFRLVSQTGIHYQHSDLSHGSAGNVHGGDRLPWLGNDDNFAALKSLDWQIHVHGQATDALQSVTKDWKMSLHSFPWSAQTQSAGFARDAMYLVRPDGHVALASKGQDIPQLDRYCSKWLLR